MGCSEGDTQGTQSWVQCWSGYGAGVLYSTGVGWVVKKRYMCSGTNSEWNELHEGPLERSKGGEIRYGEWEVIKNIGRESRLHYFITISSHNWL